MEKVTSILSRLNAVPVVMLALSIVAVAASRLV